jgi:hypothetical protein
MNTEHFKRFRDLLERGQRPEAASALREFVASFSTLEEKSIWSREHLSGLHSKGKIRHELYEGVIFPALLDGYKRAEPWSLLWLARTSQYLHRSESLWRQVDGKTSTQLLKEFLKLCPGDEEVRRELLSKVIDWMRYSIHEWPTGILYDHNGASIDQCKEIVDELGEIRQLDTDQIYTEFFADFESKVREYIDRLMRSRNVTPC